MAATWIEHTTVGWRERTGAVVHQVAARLRGPGGYYNIGNAFGLGMGIALQMESIPAGRSGLGVAHGDAFAAMRVLVVMAMPVTCGRCFPNRGGQELDRAGNKDKAEYGGDDNTKSLLHLIIS